MRNRGGALCGYVGVPESHKFHGQSYDAPATSALHVHGGLTFADKCSPDHDGICHIPEPGESESVWWLGFDCAHAGDLCPRYDAELRSAISLGRGVESYRDIAYVTAEVEQLAEQIARKRPRST